MSPKEVIKDIRAVTGELISSGLAIDQNPPSIRNVHGVDVIGISGEQDLSITLKSVDYSAAYNTLRQARSYNVLLIDGGILQFLYQFHDDVLSKHRLLFYPSPDLLDYQNSSDTYDNDELYGDIVYKGVVTSPIRLDYDPACAVELDHPHSHCTIGQYKNCRIPVTGPMTPSAFCEFILRAFYNTPFRNFLTDFVVSTRRFDVSITNVERSVIYLAAHG